MMQRKSLLVAFVFGATLSVHVFVNGQNNDFTYSIDTTKYEFSECKTSDGLDGNCRRISDCSTSNTSTKFTKSDFCSFLQDSPLYCCASNKNNLQSLDNKQVVDLESLRPAERICEYYYPSVSDGRQFAVFGIPSLPQEHPHMAAIGWTNFDGEVNWNCGGSIITPKFIITAAHCTTLRGVQPDRARSGDLNLLVTENNTFPEEYNITAIHAHPDYTTSSVYHDIALLEISPNFTITWQLKPACLWTSDVVPGTELLGMGYGTTSFAGPKANELFQVTLSQLSQEECTKNVPASAELPNGIVTGQFCAQDPKHMQDTCQGDSGGPLQFYNRSGDSRRPVIAGITSFGQNCAGLLPGVYTRVSTYLEWIEPIIIKDFVFIKT